MQVYGEEAPALLLLLYLAMAASGFFIVVLSLAAAFITIAKQVTDSSNQWAKCGKMGKIYCCKGLIGKVVQSQRRPLLGPSPG